MQTIEAELFAHLLGSHAHATLALVGTASRFTDTRKSIDARRQMRDCTTDSTIGVHVSRAKLQKTGLQFFVKKIKFSFLQVAKERTSDFCQNNETQFSASSPSSHA